MAVKNKTLLAFVVALGIILNNVQFATADGLLSRARNEVRQKTEHVQDHADSHKERGTVDRIRTATRQEEHHHESQHDEHGHNRPRKKKRHRRHRQRPSACLSFVQPQPVFVEHYFVEAAPTPVYATPVVERVIVEPVFERPSAITQPAPVVYEPALIDYEPVDWFEAWNLRATASVGSDFDDISQVGLGLLVQSNGGFGIDTSVRTLRESGADIRDNLWLGDVNLVYEAISGSFVRGRIGAGLNWLGDQYGGEAGLNLTAGFDMRLSDVWSLTGEGDVGTLGDADYFHGQLSLGRRIEAATIVFGIDHTDINGVEINSVFTGLQFRF